VNDIGGMGASEFRSVIDRIDALVVVVDRHGRVVLFNHCCETASGFTAAEVAGRPIWECLVSPAEAAAVRDAFAASLVGNAASRCATHWVTKSGTLLPIEWSTIAVPGPEGTIVLLVATGVIASDHDPSARRADDREARLRAIVETVPDAIVTIDEWGKIESFSPAAERIFGWPAAEVVGRNVSVLMPEPYYSRHDGFVRHYVETGEKRIIGIGRTVAGRRRDGSVFPMQLSVGEISLGDRRLFVGFAHDITDRTRAEAKARELQSELLHVDRMSAMGEMAASLAHELNQPLAAIMNYLQASRRLVLQSIEGEQAERTAGMLDKAAAQVERAGQTIKRLRDFLRKGETERAEEDVNRTVEEATMLALTGAPERGVHARIELHDAPLRAIIDRVQIQQVILNLVRNAIDAVLEGERREITVRVEPGERGQAVVMVADTGSGLPPDIADRLFQPFVTSKADGMGIGLSISRSIVEAHGGRIWAEAAVGGGTVFRLTLPLTDRADG